MGMLARDEKEQKCIHLQSEDSFEELLIDLTRHS